MRWGVDVSQCIALLTPYIVNGALKNFRCTTYDAFYVIWHTASGALQTNAAPEPVHNCFCGALTGLFFFLKNTKEKRDEIRKE